MIQESLMIYIAGPMRGKPENNFPAFDRAAAMFLSAGHIPVSPVTIGQAHFGNNPAVLPQEYLRKDVRYLTSCDAIALLPGWESSTGARCEVVVSLTIGLHFFDAETGLAIAPPRRVICNGGYDQPPGAVESLDDLASECMEFGHRTFPQSTHASRVEHLRREAVELCNNPDDLHECADIFILLSQLAGGGIPLARAVREKMEINKKRTWGKPDALGVVEYVDEFSIPEHGLLRGLLP